VEPGLAYHPEKRRGSKVRPLKSLICARRAWQNRKAYRLANDLVEIVTLTGGGHIAEFRFRKGTGHPSLNPLWTPPWKTIEPHHYRPEVHTSRYGPRRDGQLLCGIAGHSICLDCFGPPSDEEAEMGLSFHGEGPSKKWRKQNMRATSDRAELTLSVNLPVAGLDFTRQIMLLRGESVVYFTETVENLRTADHYFQWAEHVTLGPPFLSPGASYVVVPARDGMTDPGGYDEGKALLTSGRKFRWPMAPSVGAGLVDLSHPFSRAGTGFVSTLLLNRRRDFAFIGAVNTRLRMMIGYGFARRDFPWVALWDENRAIVARPWNGRTQACGLEFSTSPLPAGRHAAISEGPLFGVPAISCLPARRQKTVNYCAFLTRLPQGFGRVHDIVLGPGCIRILGKGRKSFPVNASGLGLVV
jgi:hypothetical protein